MTIKRIWVKGDGNAARWHAAREQGGRFVPICSGRALYSPWGVRHVECERPNEIEHAVCVRCDRILNSH